MTEETRQGAKNARTPPHAGKAAADVSSSRGVFATVADALWFLFKGWLALLLFFVVLFAVTGCEFVYLPKCQYDCTAAGGSDAYGRPVQ